MSTALELIESVEANGGRLRVDGEWLVIAPKVAAAPVREELRRHKAEIIDLLLERDANAWRDGFTRWSNSVCASRPRDFGGLNSLLISFNQWANEWAARPGATCGHEVFERLLAEAGFLVGEVAGTRLVSGLMLREDVLAYARFQKVSMPMPAMPAVRGQGDAA